MPQIISITLAESLPVRRPPSNAEIRRACKTIAAEAERQAMDCPSVDHLALNPSARADVWYALECPPYA